MINPLNFFRNRKQNESIENKFQKVSFSQSGEDLIIKYIFDCLRIDAPSYLDVGAHHPFYLSNTALFYKMGCRGINIEPDPELFQNFVIHRGEDKNLNIGVGERSGEANFYIISSQTLNTFSKAEALKYENEGDYKIVETRKVQVRTLKEIINDDVHGIFPQLLTVDAEGVDEIIIKQIDFKENFPIVICIETISFSTSGQGVKNVALISFLEDEGYLVYADTNINTIFVRKDYWIRLAI